MDWCEATQYDEDAATEDFLNDFKQEACMCSKGYTSSPYYVYLCNGLWYHSSKIVLRACKQEFGSVYVVAIYLGGQVVFDRDTDSIEVGESVSTVQV